MFPLKALIGIPGRSATTRVPVCRLACGQRRPRLLLLERLENRLCLSTWGEPVNLGPLVNTSYNDLHPALSPDGLSLYITSDRPGGFGTNNIWVSRRASLNDPWDPPQNLG